MYKYEGFKVGQVIKAFDFKPRPDTGDCYVEGIIVKVVDLPVAHYVIVVTVDVFAGRDFSPGRIGQETQVPMELEMGEYDGRVTQVLP